jgi:hypothetical protein
MQRTFLALHNSQLGSGSAIAMIHCHCGSPEWSYYSTYDILRFRFLFFDDLNAVTFESSVWSTSLSEPEA